jgi:hypothetical protein
MYVSAVTHAPKRPKPSNLNSTDNLNPAPRVTTRVCNPNLADKQKGGGQKDKEDLPPQSVQCSLQFSLVELREGWPFLILN